MPTRARSGRCTATWRAATPSGATTWPESYVSPSWYATKRETGKVVPTWNYLTVHVYGPLQTFDDPRRLREHVERLTERQEAARDARWRVSDAPEEFVQAMLK